jgi:hypothetical protein
MAGFRRMQIERRRARGSQGGGDLARHMPALADARDHHSARDVLDQSHRGGEGAAQAILQGVNDGVEARDLRGHRARGRAGMIVDDWSHLWRCRQERYLSSTDGSILEQDDLRRKSARG